MTLRSDTTEFQSPGLSARAPAAAWPGWLFGLLVIALVAGCTANRQTAEVRRGGPDIGRFTTYYVVESAPDKHGVNDLIKNRLIARGYPFLNKTRNASHLNKLFMKPLTKQLFFIINVFNIDKLIF